MRTLGLVIELCNWITRIDTNGENLSMRNCREFETRKVKNKMSTAEKESSVGNLIDASGVALKDASTTFDDPIARHISV